MKVNYDKYGKRYYFNDVKPMTFEQLEQFKEELQAICTDVYAEQMKLWADGFHGDDCEGGGCKI